ncbi:MAG: glycoside hydrolase family 15 protein [Candidatus Pacebacteria bacterium]|nr:glycoside hydrolase family 15 protein [Candidatus Paceibacterota bacterium]
MSRSLVLGNGNVLVCYDEWAQVRDFYFPQVGLENHVGEKLMHRIGVYVEGAMYWLRDGGFTMHITYEPDTLVSLVRAVHETLQIELRFSDIVYNEHDIYVRHIEVHNLADRDREVKLFFNQQFHISEAERGDTAYYSPELHAIVHYKGRRVFLVSARADDVYFDDYSVGLLGIEGKEGTWRDAEDGTLSKSGIEHGSVDSMIGLSLSIRAKSERTVLYWIAAGLTYGTVERYHRDILTRGPEHLRTTTRDFWKAWVHRTDFEACGVNRTYIDLYHRSLLVMRTHVDNQGAIIASGDSCILQSGRDTYSYCWPRDASYIVLAFLGAGDMTASKDFHTFMQSVLTDDGYLLHKYRPDGSLGSSWHPWVRDGHAQPPIQEDETAMTIITLGKHYEISRDIEFIEGLYNSYIERVANFMARYRDKHTGIPLPSHDLWEEQFATFTYTASVTSAALTTAAHFAELLGKEVARKRWATAAKEIREGICAHLFTDEGCATKSLRYTHGTAELDRTIDVSSFYGLYKYGVLDINDRRLVRAYERVVDTLSTGADRLGIARYEGDNYFRVHPGGPGNPWILTTCWVTEYEIARAKNKKDLELPERRLAWVRARANEAGLLAEQHDHLTDVPTSVTPLIWSHAQYVLTFLAYTRKLEEICVCGTK